MSFIRVNEVGDDSLERVKMCIRDRLCLPRLRLHLHRGGNEARPGKMGGGQPCRL